MQETTTPGFVDGTGEAKTTQAAYPSGPFGFQVGSVIPNFEFYGFHDPMMDATTMKPIYLADFYNPHGLDKSYQPAAGEQDDRLFPADSGYALAGKPKPVVLLVDIASVWCGPCNNEAKTLLPFKHTMYGPCGGEFLLDLHDSATPGTTATQANLKNWTKVYKVNYPSAIDPSYKLDEYFAADAYPNNLIIDTTTMKIVHAVAGEVIPGECYYTDAGHSCTQNSDCQSQSCIDPGDGNYVCDDALCGTPADLATCSSTSSLNCGGLAACNNSMACTQYDFWSIFESHLDKSRAGCNVK